MLVATLLVCGALWLAGVTVDTGGTAGATSNPGTDERERFASGLPPTGARDLERFETNGTAEPDAAGPPGEVVEDDGVGAAFEPASPPPPPPDADAEGAYVREARREGPPTLATVPDAQLIALGHAFCSGLDRGQDFESTARQTELVLGPAAGPGSGEAIGRAAVHHLCPEHEDALPD